MPKETKPYLDSLPHSTEAEKHALGCVINGETELLSILVPEDFYDPVYREVYIAMQKVAKENGGECDFILLVNELHENKRVNAIGGVAFIARLGILETTSNRNSSVTVLKKKRAERAAIEMGKRISAMGENEGQAKELPAFLLQGSKDLANLLPSNKGLQKEELITELTTDTRKVALGFEKMDHEALSGGIGPGDLFLIAARPSVGKSAMATTMAAGFLKRGIKVAFFSIEMSRRQVITRLLCAYFNKNPLEVKANAREYIAGIDTDIDLFVGINELTQIQQECLSTEADVIIIDYFGLITASRSREQGQRVTDEISRSIKVLAAHTEKPIIMLTQLNRDIEKDKSNREPQLSDLAYAGEKDADVVSFLWDPNAKSGDETQATADALMGYNTVGKELKWIVRKNRNGPSNITIPLRYDAEKFIMREELILPGKGMKEVKAPILPLQADAEGDFPF